jgi:transcriptional regulator with XRE-family HTH domain
MHKAATPIDAQIGARVRGLRRSLGLTQTDLGTALGVTFQQVQKYEKGTNRIGAGRLHDIASVLRVPVSALFDDVASPKNPAPATSTIPGFADHDQRELTVSDEGLALARSFTRISDAKVRQRVVRLVEELSRAS